MFDKRELVLALLVGAVVLGLAPSVFAADTVVAEDGGTYEIGVTLAFDVGDGDDEYNIRTADGLLVVQLVAENGTATLDTSHMDAGDYVLKDPDTGETLYAFTLVGSPSTPAATSTETATPAESGTDTPAESATDTPAESAIDPVRPELRVSGTDRATAVDATDGRVLWLGQDVAFRVDGDTGYRLSHEGETLGRLTGTDHYRYLNTTALEPGMYTVRRADGHEVYRFSLSAQTLSATTTGSDLDVASNRQGFDLVLSSSNLTRTQLLDAVPSATQQNGRVVVTDVGSSTSIPVETGSLPVGTHSLTLTVADTETTATVTLQVAARNGSATAATSTAKEAVSTVTTTPTESSTSTNTATLTEPSTSTNTATPTESVASPSTDVDAPGFGGLPVVGALILAVAVLSRRR